MTGMEQEQEAVYHDWAPRRNECTWVFPKENAEANPRSKRTIIFKYYWLLRATLIFTVESKPLASYLWMFSVLLVQWMVLSRIWKLLEDFADNYKRSKIGLCKQYDRQRV